MAIYNVVGVGQHNKFFDDNSYHDVLDYIFNQKKAVESGGYYITKSSLAAEEMEQTAIRFGKNCGKRLRHSVLSFRPEENISSEQAADFADKIIKHYGREYQIVYAVHNNTDNLHIHFVMNQISYLDGHRYRGQKKDYYAFQRHMKNVTHLPIILVKDKPLED